MNDVPEAVLHESLDLMEQGESIEKILVRYPDVASGLRPFLETAAQLATLAPQPSLAAKQKSQKAFLAHAKSLNVAPAQPSSWYRLRQILLPLASLALVVILFGATAVSVSGSAIPGDALYPVKRIVENVRLNWANDVEEATVLTDQYREERIREVQSLLRTGRTEEMSFQGEVEAVQADQWTIATIEVLLNAETDITGEPQIGETALVTGMTQSGVFIASSIDMLTGTEMPPVQVETPEPILVPTEPATVTATLEPSVEPTEDPTATPTATATATLTREPTATVTVTPTALPTFTPTVPPTAVPTTPPDNGDDDNNNDSNDNDNANDNGDDGNNNNGDDDDDDEDSNSNNGNANDNGNKNEDDDDE